MPHRYRWAGDYAAVIAGHTTPEGAGVKAIPGEEFETVEPIDTEQIPNALPIGGSPKRKARKAPDADTQTDGTTEVPSDQDKDAEATAEASEETHDDG